MHTLRHRLIVSIPALINLRNSADSAVAKHSIATAIESLESMPYLLGLSAGSQRIVSFFNKGSVLALPYCRISLISASSIRLISAVARTIVEPPRFYSRGLCLVTQDAEQPLLCIDNVAVSGCMRTAVRTASINNLSIKFRNGEFSECGHRKFGTRGKFCLSGFNGQRLLLRRMPRLAVQ